MARNLLIVGVLAGLALLPSAASAEVRQYGDTLDSAGTVSFSGSLSNLEPAGETVEITVAAAGAESLAFNVRLNPEHGTDLAVEVSGPDGTVQRDHEVFQPSTARSLLVLRPSVGTYRLTIRGRARSDWGHLRRAPFEGEARLEMAPTPAAAPASKPASTPPKARRAARKRCAKSARRKAASTSPTRRACRPATKRARRL